MVRDQIKHYPTYAQSFGLFFILFLTTGVSLLITIPFFSFKSGIGMSLIYTISMILTIGIALKTRGDFSFPIGKFDLWAVVVGSIVTISISLFLDPVTSLIPTSDIVRDLIKDAYLHPVSFFLTATLAAPILEELLFRGVILDGFLKNYNPYRAITVSAFLFALIHGNLTQGIGAFVIGLLIGFIYWKIQSVIPGIIIHFMNNFVASVGGMLTPEKDAFESLYEQLENPILYWVIVLGAGIIATGGVWLLYNKYFKQSPEVITEDVKI